jgi:hypothetical protein
LKEGAIEKEFEFYKLFPIKQIIIKRTWMKPKWKTNWKVVFKIYRVRHGNQWGEREKNIINAKPEDYLIHTLSRDERIVETIQIPLSKPHLAFQPYRMHYSNSARTNQALISAMEVSTTFLLIFIFIKRLNFQLIDYNKEIFMKI